MTRAASSIPGESHDKKRIRLIFDVSLLPRTVSERTQTKVRSYSRKSAMVWMCKSILFPRHVDVV